METKAQFEKLLTFVHAYVSSDYETEVASYTEHDQDAYLKRIRHLEQFFAGVSIGHSASLLEFNDKERRLFTAEAARLIPRSIFKIKQWRHPSEGVLYQVYLGSSTPTKTKGYGQSFLIRRADGGFKIVARYAVCRACYGTGKHDGKRCPQCYAPGWDYIEGLKLKSFGDLQETLRLEAPTNLKFLPEYESD